MESGFDPQVFNSPLYGQGRSVARCGEGEEGSSAKTAVSSQPIRGTRREGSSALHDLGLDLDVCLQFLNRGP